jgi:hypothetical protein
MLRKNRFFVQSHLQRSTAKEAGNLHEPSQIAQRDATQDKGESAWGPLFFGPSVARQGQAFGLGASCVEVIRCRIQALRGRQVRW